MRYHFITSDNTVTCGTENIMTLSNEAVSASYASSTHGIHINPLTFSVFFDAVVCTKLKFLLKIHCWPAVIIWLIRLAGCRLGSLVGVWNGKLAVPVQTLQPEQHRNTFFANKLVTSPLIVSRQTASPNTAQLSRYIKAAQRKGACG